MVTKDTLFRPTKQETKADTTNRTAREIIRSEAEARESKTATLRAARMEKEAAQAALPKAGKPAKKMATPTGD
ncbi:hypothetical protein [Rhodovulum euryhalinum]|uniref:Uncharacterized protein n=1 Tax=Rhodovulum euryhalinum TaxID=35805 RepID=A0A4R2KGY4_9RHOB|nr:hypothetical protein [Rhodovulum euryhalinum]TCO72404.1 hypothetical protein EV655_10491 [Rhodovulum euryhalinum]